MATKATKTESAFPRPEAGLIPMHNCTRCGGYYRDGIDGRLAVGLCRKCDADTVAQASSAVPAAAPSMASAAPAPHLPPPSILPGVLAATLRLRSKEYFEASIALAQAACVIERGIK